jgi:hypothetical protein
LDAIEGLKYGKVSPILAPVKRKKRGLTIRKLELAAVGMVAYRRIAYDMREEEARKEVATALGQGAETVKSWRQRLVSVFGKKAVEQHILFAENHASWVKSAREKERLGQAFEDVSFHESGYGAPALKALGQKYRAAIRAGAEKK